jgi:hypothetical protein
LVEEAAAAAESLQDQAAKLAEAVSVFKLEGGSYRPHAAHPVLSDVARPKASTLKALKSTPRAVPAPVARAKNRVVAGGGSDEWEEF